MTFAIKRWSFTIIRRIDSVRLFRVSHIGMDDKRSSWLIYMPFFVLGCVARQP